jgi:hypothetical protein
MPSLGIDNVEVAVGDTACARRPDGQVRCSESPWTAARSLDFGGPARQLSLQAEPCALREDGAVACLPGVFSRPADGGGDDPWKTPVVIPDLRDVVEVAGGCARKRDHTVWCWGRLVGDGTNGVRPRPVQIHFCPERP